MTSRPGWVLGACLMAGAGCGGDPDPTADDRAAGAHGLIGDWQGETDEGSPISFLVTPAGLTHMNLNFKLPACEWGTEISLPQPAALPDGVFETRIDMSAGAMRADLFVLFSQDGQARGRVEYLVGGQVTGCEGSGKTRFTAVREAGDPGGTDPR